MYDADELAIFAGQFAFNNNVTFEDAVELIYREDGYFLAEAQVSTDGQSVVVHEGEIDAISIEGVESRGFTRIKSYLESLVGKTPLSQTEFERAVMIANDLAGVELTTELDYPDPNAGARLRVIVYDPIRHYPRHAPTRRGRGTKPVCPAGILFGTDLRGPSSLPGICDIRR